jgi:tetratricopeptide (TPR) repeat protein
MTRSIALLSYLLLTCLLGQAQDAKGWYEKGLVLKKEQKIKEAADAFQQALKLDANLYGARYELGWCQNDLKDYKGALANLRILQNVDAWKKIPKLYFERGYAMEKLEMYDSAIVQYNYCAELKPDYSNVYKQLFYIAYNKNNYQQGLDYCVKHEANAKSPITDYLYWYRKGFSCNALQQYVDAKIYLKKSLETKQDYQNTWLELGFASSKLKEADEAIGYFNSAKDIDPKSHIPYNGIAEVYRDVKKDMNEAMNWYKKTLTVKPDERKACFGMGYCLNSQSKYSEAIPYLRKAIQQEPTYTAAYVELGYGLYKTGAWQDGLVQLDKALQLNPKNENARFYACLIYVDQKNKVKAQQMVDELKTLNSKHATGLQTKVNGI